MSSFKSALQKWLLTEEKHAAALAARERWPLSKLVKDIDPESIPGDKIEVPTHLMKYLQKTKAANSRAMSGMYKAADAENVDIIKELEKYGKLPF